MKNPKSNIISGMTVDGVSQTPKVENTQPIKRTKEVAKTAEDNVEEGLQIPSSSEMEAVFVARIEGVINDFYKILVTENDIERVVNELKGLYGDEYILESLVAELEKLKESNNGKKRFFIQLIISYLSDQYENFQEALGKYNNLRDGIRNSAYE